MLQMGTLHLDHVSSLSTMLRECIWNGYVCVLHNVLPASRLDCPASVHRSRILQNQRMTFKLCLALEICVWLLKGLKRIRNVLDKHLASRLRVWLLDSVSVSGFLAFILNGVLACSLCSWLLQCVLVCRLNGMLLVVGWASRFCQQSASRVRQISARHLDCVVSFYSVCLVLQIPQLASRCVLGFQIVLDCLCVYTDHH